MSALAQYIDRKNQWRTIFNKPAIVIPTNFNECKPHFKSLVGDLSPENLHCDGEATQEQVRERLRTIAEVWDELETISGHDVDQDEACYF